MVEQKGIKENQEVPMETANNSAFQNNKPIGALDYVLRFLLLRNLISIFNQKLHYDYKFGNYCIKLSV